MNDEGDLLKEDTRDEGNETKASRMSKLRKTRKEDTKLHIFPTEIGEVDIPNSKERIRNQMVCHKLGDTNKPVLGPGSAESHLPEDDKDSKDQTIVIKPLPLKASASAPGGEFHPNSK
uniref:Lengsin, lens protein with glutamine synthetase domain n=1 Tax=Balaenoptera musculus TaxID=9771 RepID=A0A8C0E6B8_BALMU